MFGKGKLEQNSYSNQSINMQWQEDSAIMMLAKKNINKMEMTKKGRWKKQQRDIQEHELLMGFEKLTTPC